MSTDEPDRAHDDEDLDEADALLDEPDELDDDDPDDGSRRPKRQLSLVQEVGLLLSIAVVLAIVIKTLVLGMFYIPSASMEPGLIKNDRIVVQKVSYWFGGSPDRGDVVVFGDPDHWLTADEEPDPSWPAKALSFVGLYPSGGHLVKRVIGVAGDVIHCCDKDGHLVINGVSVDESDFVAPGLPCDGPMVGDCSTESWTAGPVPAGHVFVMGDNRDNSADSSYHMCLPNQTDCNQNPYVDVGLIVGKVFALVWPRDRMRWIGTPDDFADVPDADPSADAPAAPTIGGR